VNPGDNAWQLTAATLVGLMSVPGLVVLYGADAGALVGELDDDGLSSRSPGADRLVFYGFKMAFGSPLSHLRGGHRVSQHHVGNPGFRSWGRRRSSRRRRFRE